MPGTDSSAGDTVVNRKVSNHPDLLDTVSHFKTERPISWKTFRSWRNQGQWSPTMSYKIAPLSQSATKVSCQVHEM